MPPQRRSSRAARSRTRPLRTAASTSSTSGSSATARPRRRYSARRPSRHTFTRAGIYFVTLTVTDDVGVPPIQRSCRRFTCRSTPTRRARRPTSPTRRARRQLAPLGREPGQRLGQRLRRRHQRAARRRSRSALAPRSVAIAPGRTHLGRRTRRSRRSASSSPATPEVVQTLDAAVRLAAVSASCSRRSRIERFVVLDGSGAAAEARRVRRGAQLGMLAVGANPRHVAIDGAGTSVYVSRFVTPPQPGEETASSDRSGGVSGGEVLVVDAARDDCCMRRSSCSTATSPTPRTRARGVPNYLGAVAISPDGSRPAVPSKQDNIARGTLRSGVNLNFQNTVRAISSRIDLVGEREDYARASTTTTRASRARRPSISCGIYLFVALETSREVAVVDAHGGCELFRIDAGRRRRASRVAGRPRLYVSNFMDRTVGVYDLTPLQDTGQWNGAAARDARARGDARSCAATVLPASSSSTTRATRASRATYMSCASCHNDGGSDGRVVGSHRHGRGPAQHDQPARHGAGARAACTGRGTSTRCRTSKARSARSRAAPA